MSTPNTSSTFGDLPEGVPPEQRANLDVLRRALQPPQPGMRRGRPGASPVGAMRFDPSGREGAAEVDAKPGVSFLRFGDLHLKPVAGQQFVDDDDDALPELVASLDMRKVLPAEPDWVDLLCMARVGSRYVVVPVVFEETLEDPVGVDEDDENHRVGLALEWSAESAATAAQLRAAIDAEQVLGAATPAGMGVFLALVFDVPV